MEIQRKKDSLEERAETALWKRYPKSGFAREVGSTQA